MVEEFLSKFLLQSESTFIDSIDIVLMLKAIPKPITQYNVKNVKKFNFQILQAAIIAFLNKDIVNAFEFFDVKNRGRVSNVRDLIISQKTNLDNCKDLMEMVRTKVQEHNDILVEFKQMWSQLQTEKQNVSAEQLRILQGGGQDVNATGGGTEGKAKKGKKPKHK